jgi:hypothetical protein
MTHYTQQYHYALNQPAIISFAAVAPLVITSYIKRLPSNGMLHVVFMSKIKLEGKKTGLFVRKTFTSARGKCPLLDFEHRYWLYINYSIHSTEQVAGSTTRFPSVRPPLLNTKFDLGQQNHAFRREGWG